MFSEGGSSYLSSGLLWNSGFLNVIQRNPHRWGGSRDREGTENSKATRRGRKSGLSGNLKFLNNKEREGKAYPKRSSDPVIFYDSFQPFWSFHKMVNLPEVSDGVTGVPFLMQEAILLASLGSKAVEDLGNNFGRLNVSTQYKKSEPTIICY